MKIAVCDDNVVFRSNVKIEIEHYFQSLDVLVCEYDSGESLLKAMKGTTFDLIILDIEKDGIDGLETSRRIRKDDTQVLIVLLTSHAEFALEGYEVNAFRFLTKPLEREKLVKTLAAVEKQIFSKERISVFADGMEHYVSKQEIRYVKSENVYIRIVAGKASYLVRKTLKEQLKELKSPFLFQVHRSYLINLNYVVSFDGKNVTLTDKMSIPVSKTYQTTFQKAMMKFLLHK